MQTAVRRDLRKILRGLVNAEQRTRVSSARNVANPSLQEHLFISAISADGNLRILIILLNSALSAAIFSTRTIRFDKQLNRGTDLKGPVPFYE